jgi:putative copper export protein
LLDLLSLVRALHFAATLLLVGTLFFEAMIVVPAGVRAAAPVQRLWSWTAWICIVITLLSGAAWLVILAGSLSGETIVEAYRSGTAALLLTDTRFGWVWIIRFVLLLIVVATLRRRRTSSVHEWTGLIASASLLTTLALPGHSGAKPGIDGAIYLAVDIIHLLAAAVWVGSLLPLALLLNDARRSDDVADRKAARTVVQRFSVFAIGAVAVLAVTGTVNSWNLVGNFTALFGTAYGLLLVQKLALVAVMIGVATINRYWLTPRMTEPGAILMLWRNTVLETGLAALVLIAVGFLGTTPPGTHDDHAGHLETAPTDDSAFVHIHGTRAMADVAVAPGLAGVVRITIRLMREDLTPLPAERTSLTLVHPQSSHPLVLPVRQAGPGEWKAGPTTLPLPGIWTARIGVTLASGSEELLDGPIVIGTRGGQQKE